MYSLKKELVDLENISNIFDNFEKETFSIDKGHLSQIEDLSLLLKIKNLSSGLKNKKEINKKLSSLHFNLNLLKNKAADKKSIKDIVDIFLHNEDSKIDNIIIELNDFKNKLDKIKQHHSKLLPKGLDNKIELEAKYNSHLENLHSIHKRQKNALISMIRLFIKYTRKNLKAMRE